MDDNVIDITGILAIKEIQDILELSRSEAISIYTNLIAGSTLAEALREIGISSASEIGLETWPALRTWRTKYFPDNTKFKDPEDLTKSPAQCPLRGSASIRLFRKERIPER